MTLGPPQPRALRGIDHNARGTHRGHRSRETHRQTASTARTSAQWKADGSGLG
ncbi:hypothetical protein PAXRUDRAFT_822081 [Paxillus rubicundulus Ve08.2h10]|uniref:Uncharacterized protein n=1 Tax=Paxillus rubicundulus Ve08.2h10 TaxID=930991 RepID=A0A0D0DMQ5_9AGAM|nr:hypothetical protein PAXRUDRAFT_822081 [Paxillus rubicundulus Ve08.2h10]